MASLWRGVIREYADRLPMLTGAPVVTLEEGGTPLIPARAAVRARPAPTSGSSTRA